MINLTISVVIPAYNEEETIASCLKAVTEQEVLPKEIIVVSNKSTDNTLKIATEFKANWASNFPEQADLITILEQNEFQGLIPTRNFGMAHATGDIIGRIDADAILSPKWTIALAKEFANPQVMGATGPVTYYDMPARRFSYNQDNAVRKLIRRSSGVVPMMFGTNMAVRAKAWQAVGRECCLDKDDVLHEDIDISIHFALHSYEVRFCEEMLTGMSARRIEDNYKNFKAYQQRMLTTFEKHDLSPTTGAKMSRLVFLLLWFPLHAMRPLYLKHYEKMKDQYLEELWSEDGKMSPLTHRIRMQVAAKFSSKINDKLRVLHK